MTGKRISAQQWKDRETIILSLLMEHGPCTARDLTYHLYHLEWDKGNTHSVAMTLTRLKLQGKAEIVSTHNDVKTWKVKE